MAGLWMFLLSEDSSSSSGLSSPLYDASTKALPARRAARHNLLRAARPFSASLLLIAAGGGSAAAASKILPPISREHVAPINGEHVRSCVRVPPPRCSVWAFRARCDAVDFRLS